MSEGDAGGAGGAGTGDPGAGGGGDLTPWTSGMDEAGVGYVTNKGWKTSAEMLESYRSMETMIGVPSERLLRLPEDMSNADAMAPVHAQLGRPETAEGYEFPEVQVTEGQEDVLTPKFREWAHTHGLSQKQARGIMEAFQAEMTTLGTATEEARQEQLTLDHQTLHRNWGDQYDAKIQAGKNAAKGLGLDEPTMAKMESVVGTQKMLEMMAKIGDGIAEYRADAGDPSIGGQFGITPQAAIQKITELSSDPEYIKQATSVNPAENKLAQEKMRRLQEIAYPAS